MNITNRTCKLAAPGERNDSLSHLLDILRVPHQAGVNGIAMAVAGDPKGGSR